jgi:hypothetical protein
MKYMYCSEKIWVVTRKYMGNYQIITLYLSDNYLVITLKIPEFFYMISVKQKSIIDV